MMTNSNVCTCGRKSAFQDRARGLSLAPEALSWCVTGTIVGQRPSMIGDSREYAHRRPLAVRYFTRALRSSSDSW